MNSKAERKELFTLFINAKTPKDYFVFQETLVDKIISAEKEKKSAKDRIQKIEINEHLNLLRRYGDSLVWQLLHPFAIRQFAKPDATKPHLSGQSHAIAKALEIVKFLAEQGIYAILCDLTNIIRLSDILIIRHPEYPEMIEIKGDKYIMMLHGFTGKRSNVDMSPIENLTPIRGRQGRQISKMRDTLKYLKSGKGKIYGSNGEFLTIAIQNGAQYLWKEIDETVLTLLGSSEKQSWRRISHKQYFFATVEEEINLVKGIPEEIKNFSRLFFGCHYVPIEDSWDLISPPLVWEISDSVKWALMEGEVMLFNFIDLSLFFEMEFKKGIIKDANIESDTVLNGGFLIEIDGKEIHTSKRFLDDAIYGFETVESVSKSMIELTQRAIELGLGDVLQ